MGQPPIISSAQVLIRGEAKDPILAIAGWLMADRQTRILVARLSPNSKHRYSEAFSEELSQQRSQELK